MPLLRPGGAARGASAAAPPLSATGEKAIAELFKMIDKNENGQLEKSEQKRVQKRIHSMTLPKARWKWKDMDTDGDGVVSCVILTPS